MPKAMRSEAQTKHVLGSKCASRRSTNSAAAVEEFRPNLAIGNTILLKHAPQCPESAEAIQEIFREVGFPDGAYETILATNDQIADVIADTARTGKIGDGKIWITEVARVIRIRTGEVGSDAV